MNNILGIEASYQGCSVALALRDQLHESFRLISRNHSQMLLPMVSELIESLPITLSEIDAVAYSAGPGSFTGIRLTAGIVQGLSYSLDAGVIPVSTLKVIAAEALRELVIKENTHILVAEDARMNEVYFNAFSIEEGAPVSLGEDRLVSQTELSGLRDYYSDKTCCFVGGGWENLEDYSVVIPRARSVVELVDKEGLRLYSHQATPVYLRESISWKKWQKKSAS